MRTLGWTCSSAESRWLQRDSRHFLLVTSTNSNTATVLLISVSWNPCVDPLWCHDEGQEKPSLDITDPIVHYCLCFSGIVVKLRVNHALLIALWFLKPASTFSSSLLSPLPTSQYPVIQSGRPSPCLQTFPPPPSTRRNHTARAGEPYIPPRTWFPSPGQTPVTVRLTVEPQKSAFLFFHVQFLLPLANTMGKMDWSAFMFCWCQCLAGMCS